MMLALGPPKVLVQAMHGAPGDSFPYPLGHNTAGELGTIWIPRVPLPRAFEKLLKLVRNPPQGSFMGGGG